MHCPETTSHSFQLPTGQSSTCSSATTAPILNCAAETSLRLDLRQLGEPVCEYYIQGLQSNLTLSAVKSYSSAKSRFVQFCHNINQSCIQTLLCLYVSHLANDNVSASSIKVIFIRDPLPPDLRGYQDPHIGDMPRLSQVLRGKKKKKKKKKKIAQSRQGPGSCPRLPITSTILCPKKKKKKKKVGRSLQATQTQS